MAEEDPYSDIITSADAQERQQETAPVLPADTNPAAAMAALNPFLQRHQQAMEARRPEIEALSGQQQMSIDQMAKLLDETTTALKRSREGQVNLPLLALGAGMLSSRGNFGQQLGAGLSAMVPTVQQQRMEEDQFQNQIANLTMKKAVLQNAPTKTKLDYLMALQKGDIDTIKAIEVQLSKAAAGAGGTLTVDQKLLAQVNKDREAKGLPPMAMEEFLPWRQNLQQPAEMKKYQEYAKTQREAGLPVLGPMEWAAQEAMEKARAKEQGKGEAEAGLKLPQIRQNLTTSLDLINQMKAHPGRKNFLGTIGTLPAIPGTDKWEYVGMWEQLTSQAFLDAYAAALKGAGQISNIEGVKGAQAYLRNARGLKDEAAVNRALDYFAGILQNTLNAAEEQAGASNKKPAPKADAPKAETPKPAAKPISLGSEFD